jgi:hypothetical protein
MGKKAKIYLEYPEVEDNHDDTRDVERRQRRVDDKVRVKERANGVISVGGVVQPGHDGYANCC